MEFEWLHTTTGSLPSRGNPLYRADAVLHLGCYSECWLGVVEQDRQEKVLCKAVATTCCGIGMLLNLPSRGGVFGADLPMLGCHPRPAYGIAQTPSHAKQSNETVPVHFDPH